MVAIGIGYPDTGCLAVCWGIGIDYWHRSCEDGRGGYRVEDFGR